MIQQAHQWMQNNDFDFLITGEVLGQRPKSQRKDTLPIATELTDDRIVRPLSAKLLKPTLPEREGWINRELLCDFNGRSRKPQIELAHHFGFQEFPQPAGGCVLTESKFCDRLQDLIDHTPNKNYTLDQILLLRIGRHFRINDGLKVIVGRNDTENKFIETLQNKYKTLQCISHTGALIILDGEATDENIKLCAQIAGHFSKGRDESDVTVQLYFPHATINTITTKPINPDTMRL